MSKQLMIYNNIQPFSDLHKDWSVSVENHAFAKNVNSLPLLVSEFALAAPEFPIVFTQSSDGFMIPLVVLGLSGDSNLLLDENHRFTTNYLPAFVRRYPFVLSGSVDADVMTVCLDEDADCFYKDGSKGIRLVEENGEQSEQFKGLIEFLKDYQMRAELTRQFSERLKELDLFEPMSAQITYGGDKPVNINLTGFSVINIQKLKALSDEVILELFKNDGLEVIYAQIQSMNNFNKLIELLSKQLKAGDTEKSEAEATA